MDIILVPGLWLNASSWDQVVPMLTAAGHRPHPLTLPGMESRDIDRAGISRQDHVDAVVTAIDSIDPASGKAVLVGHSAGAALAHAAIDARPDRIACAIYIGGFPVGDGIADLAELAGEGDEVPLPAWTDFGKEDLVDLDDALRAELRRQAIPSPVGVVRDRQQVSNERRYEVPVTFICTEFTSQMLRALVADGHLPVQEISKIRKVDYIDLPAGHWPQFTKPEELARAILQGAGGVRATG